MVKTTAISEISLEDSMFKIADEMFNGVKNPWAASHPHNVQRKYNLEIGAYHHGKPIPGVAFSLWAFKPYNRERIGEELTRVIEVYPTQNKIAVSDPTYFTDALSLAENFQRSFQREFTVEKNYNSL